MNIKLLYDFRIFVVLCLRKIVLLLVDSVVCPKHYDGVGSGPFEKNKLAIDKKYT